MRCVRYLMALGIFALPLCSPSVTYYIDITPKTDNDIYQMNINDTVTFQAKGFKKDQETNVTSEADIEKLWWNFDKDILNKISSQSNSITLKATKSGAAKLTAIGTVQNHNCTKTLIILVKDKLITDEEPASSGKMQ